jgi:hypothetical protein
MRSETSSRRTIDLSPSSFLGLQLLHQATTTIALGMHQTPKWLWTFSAGFYRPVSADGGGVYNVTGRQESLGNFNVRLVLGFLGILVLQSMSGCWIPLPAGAALSAGHGAPSTGLVVYGGDGHKTFLGCLDCSKYDSNAILNPYGSFGSKYSSTSILNEYGEFGSRYSSYSACNQYASDPPVVIDGNGQYHGRLTVNRYGDAIQDGEVLSWLAAVCAK